MRRSLVLLALLAPLAWSQSSGAPSYSAAGLVNAATNLPGPLAPNSLATLYGSSLSWTTVAVDAASMTDAQFPVKVTGVGVQVLFAGGTPARLMYVSPTQINFLIPPSRTPGDTTLMVVRDGMAGPAIPVTVADVAPGIFQVNSVAVASHADGSLITADAPAAAGESIVVSCTGLGQTVVPLDSQDDGKLVPMDADPATIEIRRFPDLAVTLDGAQIDPERILWAGLSLGFAGMYQVNLQLPDDLGSNPEIRVSIGSQASPPGVKLAAQP